MTQRLLLDTSSLMYRAFFALPTSITGEGGQPVNALRGYLDMTARLVTDHRPDEVLHAGDDDWRPAPRVAAYAGYKSARNEEPPELTVQFRILLELLDALGQAWVVAPGWEADDAIGTLCAQAQARDHLAIVSGDRDLMQLVRDGDPSVRLLYTVKGVSELAVCDEETVHARYGVAPSRYVDFAILRGDPSDGLPGVKGIGPKTAQALIDRAGTIETLLDDLDGLRPAVAASLQGSRDYLAAMRDVVPVRCDVALAWRRGVRDDKRVDALGERWNLVSPLRRIRDALDAGRGAAGGPTAGGGT